jgi:hypothetical protein
LVEDEAWYAEFGGECFAESEQRGVASRCGEAKSIESASDS